MKDRERERERRLAQSAAAERVSRCYCMSPRPTILQQERHNTSLDTYPLPALIWLLSFYWAFDFKQKQKQNNNNKKQLMGPR